MDASLGELAYMFTCSMFGLCSHVFCFIPVTSRLGLSRDCSGARGCCCYIPHPSYHSPEAGATIFQLPPWEWCHKAAPVRIYRRLCPGPGGCSAHLSANVLPPAVRRPSAHCQPPLQIISRQRPDDAAKNWPDVVPSAVLGRWKVGRPPSPGVWGEGAASSEASADVFAARLGTESANWDEGVRGAELTSAEATGDRSSSSSRALVPLLQTD